MVFVPEGPFVMGNNSGQFDEKPERSIVLSAYCIDTTEVTNGAYHECIEAGVCRPPPQAADSRFSQKSGPVVGISWFEAAKYCGFVVKRLPTEAEWEKAARGTEAALFPWGDEPAERVANCSYGCGDLYEFTAPVGSFPEGASPVGALDMAGNVTEWVNDYYGEGYSKFGPAVDPPGPRSGVLRVVRGGSYRDVVEVLRASNRYYKRAEEGEPSVGFRCALSIDAGNRESGTGIVERRPQVRPLLRPAVEAHPASKSDRVLIPAGPALVGSSEAGAEESPQRTVRLPSFAMDVTEVTTAAFARCVENGTCRDDGILPFSAQSAWRCNLGKPGRDQHPINCVTRRGAEDFCRQAGGRLPSEDEWEKAASGGMGRLYPWGSRMKPFSANCDDVMCGDGYVLTAPVGSFPGGASPYGLLDMSGNVMEWTSSDFTTTRASDARLYGNRLGMTEAVLKGGSWKHFDFFMRSSARNYHMADSPLPEAGFRCAYDVEER